RLVGNSPRTVADVEVDALLVAGLGKALAGPLRELGDPLDRVHFGRQLGEYRGLVAGARADVEHPLLAVKRELLRDQRDHVRLGDRLSAADGERGVSVDRVAQLGRYEEFSRHA